MIFFPLLLILFVVAPLAELRLGETLIRLIARIIKSEPPSLSSRIPAFVLGLLFHLHLSLLIRCLGLGLPYAFLIPILPFLHPLRLREELRSIRLVPSFNFAAWFAVILALGISLFNAVDGITTPWMNNYGDLSFHIGMISSFTFGDNFPPQYHIFPGVKLSYPYLINFWSAALWSYAPSEKVLPLIFTYQWTLIWCLAYWLLFGNRFVLFPWAVLFGGGTVAFLKHVRDSKVLARVHSGQLIDHGYPWSSFLTTVWITQRSVLLGLAAILSALYLFHIYLRERSEKEDKLKPAICGGIISLSILAHTHFALAAGLYIGMVLVGECVQSAIAKKSWDAKAFLPLLLYLLFLIPLVFTVPQIAGKAGMLKPIVGWMPYTPDGTHSLLTKLRGAVMMWLSNAPAAIFCAAVLLLLSPRLTPMLALGLLFLLGNRVLMAVWPWDQIKFFVALYLIALSLWSSIESPSALWAHLTAIFLIIPSLFETALVMFTYTPFTVYTTQEIAMAESIRKMVNPHEILLAKPDHNSLVTLTGRKMYVGYDGTLYSHNIDYRERMDKASKPTELLNCDRSKEICPDYLLWTTREIQWLKGFSPVGSHLQSTPLTYLYKMQKE